MKRFSQIIFLVSLLFLHAGAIAHAATIAIVDTGFDRSHPYLENSVYKNSYERVNGRDDDRNGYKDDVYGWNFITMDYRGFRSETFPYFNDDFYRYYEIRRKRSLGTVSEEEQEWYQEKRKDDAFQETRKLFRRSIHATHVAGLAIGLGLKQILGTQNLPYQFERPKLLNITYLGDATFGPAVEPEYEPLKNGSTQSRLKHLQSFMNSYLTWQKNKLSLAVSYASNHANIVNASFGISYKSAGNMVEGWWDQEFDSKDIALKAKLLNQLQDNFRVGLIRITKDIVKKYKGLIFVFSAGNGNDPTMEESHYPSGVKCDRCLTVGATLGTKEKASFSNYGKESVSLYAPGVAMKSLTPEQRILPVNGTSQAAPQVSFTAANILSTAIKEGLFIRPSTVKDILLASVDQKDFLKDQCSSGGILNPLRAIYLTRILGRYNWKTAVKRAQIDISPLEFMPYSNSKAALKSSKIPLKFDNDELLSP